MIGHNEISNGEDIIDSRDVIARIEYLEGLIDDYKEALSDFHEAQEERHGEEDEEGADVGGLLEPDRESFISLDEDAELDALKALEEEASSSPDWKYGEMIIRDSYFEDYARQFAEDVGYIKENASWPYTHIDWAAAADELKQDYISVDFDGVEYWIRA